MTGPSRQIRITVLMPALNAGTVIRRAIESVRTQEHKHWTLLVIDNGSSDSTREIAREMSTADPRIRLLECTESGAAAARNVGLAAVDGEGVAFLDADDEWRPSFLALAAEALREDVDLFSAGYCIRTKAGAAVQIRRPPAQVSGRTFLWGNPFGILATVVNFRRNPAFRFQRGRKEDMRAWYGLVSKPGVRCVTSQAVVADYTIASRASHAKRKAGVLGAHFRFFRDDMKMGLIPSFAATLFYVLRRGFDYFLMRARP